MAIIPFSIAWYLAQNPGGIKLGTNNGLLIDPVVITEISDFAGYDGFTADNLKELQGHWVMINLVTNKQCQAICQDALYKTHQISLMMGKDIARIRRMVVMPADPQSPVLNETWQADARLLKISAAPALVDKIQRARSYEEGVLVIMDPLGNLMMHYPAGYDPYKVRNDLSKLLRISQIG